jgi:hypothetical protein
MEVVVLRELEAVDEGERGLDLARFGDRCGAVQLRDSSHRCAWLADRGSSLVMK